MRRMISHCTADLDQHEIRAALTVWSNMVLSSRRTGRISRLAVKPQSSIEQSLTHISVSVALFTVDRSYVQSMLNKTSNLTRQLIQDDHIKYTQTIAAEAAEAARKGQARALHSCVRKLGPAKIMRPQMVKTPEGLLAKTPLQAKQMWQTIFVNKLAGAVRSFEDISKHNVCTQAERFREFCNDRPNVSIMDIPAIQEVDRLLRISPTDKRFGEDLIPGEVLRAAPEAIGTHLHPLCLRALFRIQEPFMWKVAI